MVFRTSVEYLKQGLQGSDAPIRRHTGLNSGSCCPFLALADPDGNAAAIFRVHKQRSLMVRSFFKAIVTPSIFREIYLNGVRGGDTLLPSEFLIDEDGLLVDLLRARKKTESMALGRINDFLLSDLIHNPPCRDINCNGKISFRHTVS